jgi:hypothetical protein
MARWIEVGRILFNLDQLVQIDLDGLTLTVERSDGARTVFTATDEEAAARQWAYLLRATDARDDDEEAEDAE